MKKFVLDFLRRGIVATGLGPIVLAILYLILHRSGIISTLTVRQVCVGIFSLSALAFVAGGMNAVYQVEKLPLMGAILLHGSVLYGGYLVTYLLNDWLEWSFISVLAFTGIFVVGYLVIWGIIYSIIRKNTNAVNEALKRKQRNDDLSA